MGAEAPKGKNMVIPAARELMAHVLMVTFNSQGHVNPFLRFANRLASKGILVTFSSTFEVAHKIKAAASSAAGATPLLEGEFTPIGDGYLRFEWFSDGWPVPDPRRNDLIAFVPQLAATGAVEFASLIRRQEEQGRPVTCVINNPFLPWALDVAAGMGVPVGLLWVQSAAVFSTYYHYHHRLAGFPTVMSEPDAVLKIPGLPDLEPGDVPTFLLPSDPYTSITSAILAQFKTLHKARWVFVNTFDELERDVVDAFAAEHMPFIPVGPLVELPDNPAAEGDHSCNGDGDGEQRRGRPSRAAPAMKVDLLRAAAEECMAWLGKQSPKSVVYASVGSVVMMGRQDVEEMAWGLKNAGRPFLWVVRKETRPLLPEGFEEACGEQGMVVSWSPQDRVLAHPSLGCFLTHCGWNSTLECLASGAPAITFPHFGDQTTDAKFLVDVYGVGVHLRPSKGVDGSFGREDVERAVREAMEGPRVEEIRRRAEEWKEAARRAVEEGGSSDGNIGRFAEEVRGLCLLGGGGPLFDREVDGKKIDGRVLGY